MGTQELITQSDINDAAVTSFLDSQFPLRSGTHNDVRTYLVYFDHLMAIKADGSTTSLITPSQYVEADGSLDGPTAISLSNGTTQVEIRLHTCNASDKRLHPCIDDVRVETVLSA